MDYTGSIVGGLALAISVGSVLFERLSASRAKAQEAEQRASAAGKDENAALRSLLATRDAQLEDMTKSRDHWQQRALECERVLREERR